MESLLVGLVNWKTTLVGLLIAVVTYMAGVGNKLPENKQEWTAFGLGVLALALGIATKDATTGSRPKVILLPLIAAMIPTGLALWCGSSLVP